MTERLPSPRRPNARQRDSTYQTWQRCSDKRDHLSNARQRGFHLSNLAALFRQTRPPLLALFGVLSPLGRKVESELRRRLGDVSLDWSELRASDLSGRARAFQSMVGAGIDISKAAGLAGLMDSDD